MDIVLLFARIISLLIFTVHCYSMADSPIVQKLERLNLRCDINNSKYWDIIEWYFERTPFVVATSITEGHRERLDFSSVFLKQLTNLKLSVYLSKVDYYNEEDPVSFANTFDWKGQKFELRVTEKLMRNKRQIDAGEKSTKTKKQRRLDEPGKGALVFAQRIDVINKYLVAHADNGWKETGAVVLERLWKSYGIIHAMLMAPCSRTGEAIIGQYDPFYVNDSIINPLSSNYGRCTWTTVDNFDFDNRLVRKLASLNQFPLRISLFPRYPTVLEPTQIPPVFTNAYFTRVSSNINSYSGLDAIVLGNMAEAIDFRPDIRRPIGNDYGYKLSNGTFIGSLGDVLYRRVYASFNSRFTSDYGTDDLEYMFPVYSDKVCVIAPKALKVPQWMAIFKCFSTNLWLFIVFINTMCGCFWYLLKSWTNKCYLHINESETSQELRRLSVISIEMWIIMLGGASKRLPYRSMERVFLSVCLVSNIIIAGTFQGSLFTAYRRTTYFKDINTLEELDKSGLPIGTTSANLKDLFSGVGTPVLNALNAKFSVLTGQGVITRTARDRNICCLERFADINVIISTNYELNDGTVQLHQVKECPRSYYLSYIVKKGWPFKPVFDNVIQRYFEGGLLVQWHSVVEESIIYRERLKRLQNGSNLKVFSLDDMQTAFYILCIGLFCCSLVFLCEIIYKRKHSCSKHIKTACECNLKFKRF